MKSSAHEPPTPDLFAVKAAAKREFGDIDGVEGFGIGDGTLRIYIRHADMNRTLPKHFRGVNVDLVVTGDIIAQA